MSQQQEKKKEQAKTSLVYQGVTYPYYRTNRGMYDFENSEFSIEDVRQNSHGAMLAQIYHQLRDCAKRANIAFRDSFQDFIDNSDADIVKVFVRLLEEEKKKLKEEASSKNK